MVENCVHPGFYTASSGNLLPTFRDKPSDPTSGVENPNDLVPSYSIDGTGFGLELVSCRGPIFKCRESKMFWILDT